MLVPMPPMGTVEQRSEMAVDAAAARSASVRFAADPVTVITPTTVTEVGVALTVEAVTVSGGTSLTSLKGAVFSQVTPDLWTAPIKQFSNGTTNGSSVCSIDVTGLGLTIGNLCGVVLTNSDGTSTAVGTQSATRRFFYIVGTLS